MSRAAYCFRLHLDLDQLPSDDLDFSLWLVDWNDSRLGSAILVINDRVEVTLRVDDMLIIRHAFTTSGAPGSGGKPAYLERPLA